MRTRGTKEIVATADGQGFVALFENGELWRHNTMTHTWVRVLTPEEMDTRSKITPRSEAERLAGEDKRFEAPKTAQEAAEAETYATVSVSEAERLEALSLAQRVVGGARTTDGVLRLARWVISKFGGGDAR